MALPVGFRSSPWSVNDAARFTANSYATGVNSSFGGKVFIAGSIYIMDSDNTRSATGGVSKDSLCKERDRGVLEVIASAWTDNPGRPFIEVSFWKAKTQVAF